MITEVPNKDALRSRSPQPPIMEKDIVDILCMANINLMRLPQEGVIPYPNK
jgi:hypothetical protein